MLFYYPFYLCVKYQRIDDSMFLQHYCEVRRNLMHLLRDTVPPEGKSSLLYLKNMSITWNCFLSKPFWNISMLLLWHRSIDKKNEIRNIYIWNLDDTAYKALYNEFKYKIKVNYSEHYPRITSLISGYKNLELKCSILLTIFNRHWNSRQAFHLLYLISQQTFFRWPNANLV